MRQADKSFGSLARDILDGNLDDEMKVSNITGSSTFFNTTERVARDKRLLQEIINNELKRLKVYEARNPNSTFSTNQKLLIDKLEAELADNNEIEGIYSFAENALDTLSKLDNRLVALQNTPATSVNGRAKILRDVRNYLYSYKHIVDDIRAALIDEERYDDNRYGERVRVTMNNITTLLGDLFVKYKNTSLPSFVSFIKPFVGESIIVPLANGKEK